MPYTSLLMHAVSGSTPETAGSYLQLMGLAGSMLLFPKPEVKELTFGPADTGMSLSFQSRDSGSSE